MAMALPEGAQYQLSFSHHTFWFVYGNSAGGCATNKLFSTFRQCHSHSLETYNDIKIVGCPKKTLG
jgi:hypothetical protein